MSKVNIFCALPCAGKTTFAKKIEAEHGATRYTLDEHMRKLCNYSITDERYGNLAAIEKLNLWNQAQVALDNNKDVILDWSLWNRKVRKEWVERICNSGHQYILYYLPVPIDILKKRAEKRNLDSNYHNISIEELERFSKLFEPPHLDEGLICEIVNYQY